MASLILCGISFFSCQKNHPRDELTLAVAADIRGFDPALATDLRTGKVIALVYDNLVRFGSGTELLPCLAKSWSVNESGTDYLFRLNTKAEFHDNSRLTAADVVYSFERVLSPETVSPQTWLFDRIKGAHEFMAGETETVSGLRAINDSLLVIEIDEPFVPFIQYLAMPSAAIVNSRFVNQIKEEPAGSGPWELQQWERDGEIVFTRNETYWEEKPVLKNLRLRVLSESLARMAELEAGNLDLAGIPDMELDRWLKKDSWKGEIHAMDELNIWYVGMNCSRPPFNDVLVRRAMNLALDREKILKLLLSGSGSLSTGPVPPQLLNTAVTEPYPYDPAQARKLLIEAGYESGLHTRLWVAGGSEMFHVLEAFQADWQAVGVYLEILRSDWNVFKTAVREGKPDLYYLDWYADYPDAENFLYPLFHSRESMTKRNRYSNPLVDRNIEEIQSLPEGNKRENLIAQTHELIFRDAPWVFLWHGRSHTAVQPWISGYTPRLIFNAERFTEIFRKQ